MRETAGVSKVHLGCVLWLVLTAACGQAATAPAVSAGPPPLQPLSTGDDAAPEAEITPPAGVTHCDHLTTRLCNDLQTDTCAFVRERVAEVEDERCKLMHQHYAEVLADLRAYELTQQPIPAERWSRAINTTQTSQGPADAPVTILLFSDFQCPFCAGAAESTRTIVARYGDRVRVVFRQFPLSFHEHAHLAAEAALAAAAEGKFWALHDQLFAHQGALDRASLSQYAKEVGLNTATFNQALETHAFAAAVDADLALGMEVGVDGTPAMYLNGVRVPHAADVDLIAARIDAVLASNAATATAP